jgi:hypothetical protein
LKPESFENHTAEEVFAVHLIKRRAVIKVDRTLCRLTGTELPSRDGKDVKIQPLWLGGWELLARGVADAQ